MSVLTTGLHHVTALAGRAQANIEYYVRLLGLRLVKRTVNFDDPLTYHLYFGDRLGHPGSILSFFPWPGAGPAERGTAEAHAIALQVPAGALGSWRRTLADHRQPFVDVTRFGAEVVAFHDPDGTPLELVEGPEPSILGDPGILCLDSVRLVLADRDASATLLVDTLGFTAGHEEEGRLRLTLPGEGPGRRVDLEAASVSRPSRLGTGSVHHVAFRVPDRAALDRARESLLAAGRRPTKVKNRQYFESVYFTDPSGAILELATDGPGFTVDESADELGLALKLPAWLEAEREYFRSRLPVTASPEYADRFGMG